MSPFAIGVAVGVILGRDVVVSVLVDRFGKVAAIDGGIEGGIEGGNPSL